MGDVFYGIMGLTDRTGTDLFVPDGVYSLWTRDSREKESGKLPAKNSYSVHPFYMAPA